MVEKKFVVPEFGMGSVPVATAATVFGKDACWVRAGIISGWLPIGVATRDCKIINDLSDMNSDYGRISYYISPRKLWEITGYVWKGRKKGNDITISEEDRSNFMESIEQMIEEIVEGKQS